MATKPKKINKKKYPDLRDLFTLKLQALYDIELELIDALPAMAKNATDTELKTAFEEHLVETEIHARRISEIFTALDLKETTTKVEGIRGMIDDAKWLIKNISVATVRDASLISAALEVEHYEIAAYMTAIEWATLLGYEDAVELLQETLTEEETASDLLYKLGTSKINQEAMGDEENTEDSEVLDE